MVEDYQEEEDDANEITEHSKLNIRYHGERKEEEILIKSEKQYLINHSS